MSVSWIEDTDEYKLYLAGGDQHGDEQERWKRHPLRDCSLHHGYRLRVRTKGGVPNLFLLQHQTIISTFTLTSCITRHTCQCYLRSKSGRSAPHYFCLRDANQPLLITV